MSKPAPLLRLVVLALLAACSGKKTFDPAVDAPVAPVAIDAPGMPVAEHLIDRAASSICDALFRCCDDDLVTYFGPFRENELLKAFRDRLPPAATLDEASCKQVVGEMFQIVPFGDWVRAVNAGDVRLDAAAFDRCTAALDHATCGESMRAALWDSSCLGFAPPSGGAAQRSFVHRTQGAGATCKPIRDGVGAAFYGRAIPRRRSAATPTPRSWAAGTRSTPPARHAAARARRSPRSARPARSHRRSRCARRARTATRVRQRASRRRPPH